MSVREAVSGIISAPARGVRGARSLLVTQTPIVISVAAALAVACYALSLPNILLGVHGYSGHGYDDGVYFGAAIQLIHGSLPYRDFTMVQPPGIAILLAPIALIGQLIGDRDAFALTRILTVLVTGANAGLAASVLRSKGRAAMAISGLAFAFFPLAIAASHTAMLEPYLTLFVLIGVLVGFDSVTSGKLACTRRIFAASVMFGIAGTIKIWAIFPIVVYLVFIIVQERSKYLQCIGGILIGLVVPLVAFVIGAPSAFFHDIFFAQGGRISLSSFGSHLGANLSTITGLAGFGSLTPPAWVGIVIAVGGALLSAWVFHRYRRDTSDLDRFIGISTVVVIVGMLLSTQFVPHYAYFTAVFIALLVGTILGIVGKRAARQLELPSPFTWRSVTPLTLSLFAFVVLVATVVVVHLDTNYETAYLSSAQDNGATLSYVVPPGSCVVSDQVSYIIDANRFIAANSKCPSMLDWYGTWLADDPSELPPSDGPYSLSLVNTWNTLLTNADYLVFFSPNTEAYPRTASTTALFSQYKLVYSAPGTYTYCHITMPAANKSGAIVALNAGLAAQNQQDFTTAANDYEKSLVDAPCEAPALYDLGTVQQASGNNEAAIALYLETLSIDPNYSLATQNLEFLESSNG